MNLEELVAVVTYFCHQANPDVTGVDVDTLDPGAFGKVLQPIMDRILSQPAAPEDGERPFPDSSAALPTP